eukprot:SAG31_NODE_5679_length_2386_cov_1.692610_2_plen_179_part_00
MEDAVAMMERSHPDTVAAMFSSPMLMVRVDPDGSARSNRSNKQQWDPNHTLRQQLTRAYHTSQAAAPSASAYAIRTTDMYVAMSQPHCDEAPRHVLALIEAEPTSAIAAAWRRYARVVLVPLVNALSEFLIGHGQTIEWPALSWQRETFKEEVAFISAGLPNDFFGLNWVGYSASWAQ